MFWEAQEPRPLNLDREGRERYRLQPPTMREAVDSWGEQRPGMTSKAPWRGGKGHYASFLQGYTMDTNMAAGAGLCSL